MAGRLQGKRAIFTGAVNNIGKEAARMFVAEGARVAIGDIDDAGGSRTAQELGPAVAYFHVDVADESGIRDFVAKAVGWLGGLDILCQNAGLQDSGGVVDFDVARWDRLFAVNIRGQFLGAKYAVPHLRAAGKGAIVNMASIAGKRGGAGLTGYCASKGASVAFTNALAKELAKDNIRVNAICPGWVDTPFNDPAISYMGGKEAHARVVAAVPLGRQAQPAEIAPLYVYLASDESSFMTGQAILIDGGVHN
jgi:dihydroanticapsin dehydrogenase